MRSVDLDRPSTMTDVVLICRISTVTLKWQKCSDMCQDDQRGPWKTHTLTLSLTHTHGYTFKPSCTKTHTHTLSHFLTLSFDSFLCALCVRVDLSFCHSVSIRLSTADGFSHVWKLYHISYCTSRHTLCFLLYAVSVIWWFKVAFLGIKCCLIVLQK